MEQIFQNLKTGEVTFEKLPKPHCSQGQVVVRTTCSLISLGTEKMLLNFGKAGWLEKARQQPEKVQQVLSKIKTDGLKPTVEAVMRKLDQPLPLGYSAVGVVTDVGPGISDLKIGDRVVTNGPHAQFVTIPRNLVASIPANVSDEDASFTVVGAIGLQGVRLIAPTFGETVVVIGLGLIGLLTVQILVSHGCEVIGFDFDADKVRRAKEYGARAFEIGNFINPVDEVLSLTKGIGADGVIITASTPSDEVISQSAQMTRKRGRVVLVGVVGLDIKRSDFYEKEISFQVSCSYGPGRYDPLYEEKGLDYPVGFVRWTEGRNFEAFLTALSRGQIHVQDLITTRVPFHEAPQLYGKLGESKSELGVVIKYSDTSESSKNVVLMPGVAQKTTEQKVSFLGAGQFAGAILLPAFQANQFPFGKLGSRSGGMGAYLAKKYKFESLTSDYEELLNDPNVRSVVITTRHSSHGSLVLKALEKGKNVFVEKPLAIHENEIDEIQKFFMSGSAGSKPVLMVGFNRRYSPLARELKRYLSNTQSSKAFIMTVNAGAISSQHWTQDLTVGGGRLVGEGCHFIDLLRSLSGSAILNAKVSAMEGLTMDTYSIQLEFKNGDIGTIHYFANGSKDFPKERLEVFVGGKIIVLDNFKRLKGIGFKGLKYSLKSQDKGHHAEVEVFKKSLMAGVQPTPLDELFEVSRWCVRLQEELLKRNEPG